IDVVELDPVASNEVKSVVEIQAPTSPSPSLSPSPRITRRPSPTPSAPKETPQIPQIPPTITTLVKTGANLFIIFGIATILTLAILIARERLKQFRQKSKNHLKDTP
ncbi:MAG TPA: hypothetical protein VJK26_02855, partial [Patescibacteria group bacterium]|nr:hypothetical protein [Patescibacteria group bacterium]